MPRTDVRREFFVIEYCVDFNAAQAAIRAGYSEKTAYSQGQRLLKHVEIKRKIKQHLRNVRSETNTTLKVVMAEITILAFSDISRILDWDEKGVRLRAKKDIKPDDRAAIQEITFIESKNGTRLKVRMHDKNSALDKLAKRFNFYDPTPLEDLLSVMPEPSREYMLKKWREEPKDENESWDLEDEKVAARRIEIACRRDDLDDQTGSSFDSASL